jgi:hypothetical protein
MMATASADGAKTKAKATHVLLLLLGPCLLRSFNFQLLQPTTDRRLPPTGLPSAERCAETDDPADASLADHGIWFVPTGPFMKWFSRRLCWLALAQAVVVTLVGR